jgi:hypothetical protein
VWLLSDQGLCSPNRESGAHTCCSSATAGWQQGNSSSSAGINTVPCWLHMHCREDEFDATYCYGSGSTNQDIHDRTILPLVCKLIEGYNVCVLLTGATGASVSQHRRT